MPACVNPFELSLLLSQSVVMAYSKPRRKTGNATDKGKFHTDIPVFLNLMPTQKDAKHAQVPPIGDFGVVSGVIRFDTDLFEAIEQRAAVSEERMR